MSSRLIPAALCALALAGCGGESEDARLAPPVAQNLARQADAVAASLEAGDSCTAAERAQRLQQQTIAAINADRVPPELQEDLQGAVNALAVRIDCVPPASQVVEDEEEKDGKKKGHGKDRDGDEGDD